MSISQFYLLIENILNCSSPKYKFSNIFYVRSGQSRGGSGSVIILWMESNDAFSGTSSSSKFNLRPALQDIILLDLWFPANCFILLWSRKVLNACCILSPPPNILEKRGNVSQNPFCSLWPNKKGHGSRIWFILGHCENKGSLYKLECCAPRMVLSSPVGRTEKCRKELFSPWIHSSCSRWHGEF